MNHPNPSDRRKGPNGQRLCTRHSKQTGELCGAIAMRGQQVCYFHGGKSPQALRKAKLRLAELVEPAIATLAHEMEQADNSSDKQRAANSILDRAGWGRVQKIETADARELLLGRLMDMRAEAIEKEQAAIEGTIVDQQDTDDQ